MLARRLEGSVRGGAAVGLGVLQKSPSLGAHGRSQTWTASPREEAEAAGRSVRGGSSFEVPSPGKSRRSYPADAGEYVLLQEIGQGATASVWKARCIPLNETVAVKKVDLEKCNSTLEDFRREAQVMSMLSHPNLVKAHGFFAQDQFLWVVMPFCDAGSVLHIMKSCRPDGLDEPAIATILRETLRAIHYLHHHGLIHRDIKAGNILLESRGAVRLADFGVSACMFDTGNRQHSRKTFVGTPCWMAPEVLEHRTGYDFKADIWSFGITALELSHGHAPFEKMTPMKVLMSTLQGPSPGFDKEREKRFSKAFKEVVAMCLLKDPSKRPSADKLLKHPFFKQAKPPESLVLGLLHGLPSLEERLRILKAQEAAMIAAKLIPLTVQEEISQSEYQLGVSGWNFDLDDLKRQAALLPDDEPEAEEGPPSIATIPEDHSVRYGAPTHQWAMEALLLPPTGIESPQQQQQQQHPQGGALEPAAAEEAPQQQQGLGRREAFLAALEQQELVLHAQQQQLQEEQQSSQQQQQQQRRQYTQTGSRSFDSVVQMHPSTAQVWQAPAPGLIYSQSHSRISLKTPLTSPSALQTSNSFRELRGRFEVTHGKDDHDDDEDSDDD